MDCRRWSNQGWCVLPQQQECSCSVKFWINTSLYVCACSLCCDCSQWVHCVIVIAWLPGIYGSKPTESEGAVRVSTRLVYVAVNPWQPGYISYQIGQLQHKIQCTPTNSALATVQSSQTKQIRVIKRKRRKDG